MVGADSVMFATDYPLWDFDHPEALDKHLSNRYSVEGLNKVLDGNAAEAFGIEL